MIDLRHLPRASGRWTPLDKHSVVLAVRRGQITFAQACARFDLSSDELQSWLDGYRARGVDGLSITKLQAVRP